jgi:uncharacterized protein
MDSKLRQHLISVATRHMRRNDLSHDINHSLRILTMAEKIAKSEDNVDMDVLVPSALFHDVIIRKGTPKQSGESKESAVLAGKFLRRTVGYPKEKIEKVKYAISVCSFKKNIRPETIEARILQDADMLEATGAISIMRTFGSSTLMNNGSFFDPADPFCRRRKPDDLNYSLDLFYTRLLLVQERIHTKLGRRIAAKRTVYLRKFLWELEIELDEFGENYAANF